MTKGDINHRINVLLRTSNLIKVIARNFKSNSANPCILLFNDEVLSESEIQLLYSIFNTIGGSFYDLSSDEFHLLVWNTVDNQELIMLSKLSRNLSIKHGEVGSAMFVFNQNEIDDEKIEIICNVYDFRSQNLENIINLNNKSLNMLAGLLLTPHIDKFKKPTGIYLDATMLDRYNLEFLFNYYSRLKDSRQLFLFIRISSDFPLDLVDTDNLDKIFYTKDNLDFELVPFRLISHTLKSIINSNAPLAIFLGEDVRGRKSLDIEKGLINKCLAISSLELTSEELNLLRKYDVHTNLLTDEKTKKIQTTIKFLGGDSFPSFTDSTEINESISDLRSYTAINTELVIKKLLELRTILIFTDTYDAGFKDLICSFKPNNSYIIQSSEDWQSLRSRDLNNQENTILCYLYGTYADFSSIEYFGENIITEISRRMDIIYSVFLSLKSRLIQPIRCFFVNFKFCSESLKLIIKLWEDKLISPYFIETCDSIGKNSKEFAQNLWGKLQKLFINRFFLISLGKFSEILQIDQEEQDVTLGNSMGDQKTIEKIESFVKENNIISLTIWGRKFLQDDKRIINDLMGIPTNWDDYCTKLSILFTLWEGVSWDWMKELIEENVENLEDLPEGWNAGNINCLKHILVLKLDQSYGEKIKSVFKNFRNLKRIRNLYPTHYNLEFEEAFNTIGLDYPQPNDNYSFAWAKSLVLFVEELEGLNSLLKPLDTLRIEEIIQYNV